MNKGGYTKTDYVAFKSHSVILFYFFFNESPANKNVSHCKTKPNYLKDVINDALIRRQSQDVCTEVRIHAEKSPI